MRASSITFTKSVEEWEDTNEFRTEIYQIISYIGKIIEHLYYDTLDLSPEEYPSLIVNTSYMIENNKLMLFGEAKSVLYAFKNNFINQLIENIIAAVGEFNEDLSAPPPPVRLSKDKFNEIATEVFARFKTIEGFKHIDKDLPDLQKAIDDLLQVVDKRLNTSFESILNDVKSEKEAVAFFLALLEAVRWGFVKASQNDEGIKIEKNYEL